MNKCRLCLQTLHGARFEVRHTASNHITKCVNFLIENWREACPVCGCVFFDQRNRKAHLQNHQRDVVAMVFLELRLTALPFVYRKTIPQKPSNDGLDAFFWSEKK